MEINVLTNPEAVGGATHRIRLTAADIKALALAVNTTATINLRALLAYDFVQVVATYVPVAFKDSADAANATCAITLGDSGSAARYLASQEINANGTTVLAKEGTGTLKVLTAADNLILSLAAPTTGKTHSNYDTGVLDVFCRVLNLKSLAAEFS